MNPTSEPAHPLRPDDALPPVEPPNFGFIIQLFVVPGVIVGIIVVVWFLFNWLAQRGNDPRQYVQALRRSNSARWQVASNLADALRNPMSASTKTDHQLAAELADILRTEIQAGQTDDEDVKLQGFLAKALGEMTIPDGLPVLIEAASLEGSEGALRVRLAALESLALLASNQPADKPLSDPRLLPTLNEAASSDEGAVRSVAAFTLGVIGTDQANDRLAQMLVDAHPDVRYNAATGLSRHGDARALEVLIEMLSPESEAGLEESEGSEKAFKQQLIWINAIKAAGQLLAANPQLDTAPLAPAVERLLENPEVQGQIRVQGKDLRRQVQERQGAVESKAA